MVVVRADLLHQLRGRTVARHLQRPAQRVFVSFMLPGGQPGGTVGRDRRIEIGQQRSWRVAALERCGIDDRLERRAGLSLRLRRAIESALGEVASAHQREHVAARRIHRHQAALEIARLSALRQLRETSRRSPVRRAAAVPGRKSNARAARHAAPVRRRTCDTSWRRSSSSKYCPLDVGSRERRASCRPVQLRSGSYGASPPGSRPRRAAPARASAAGRDSGAPVAFDGDARGA